MECDHVGQVELTVDNGVKVLACHVCGVSFGEPRLYPSEELRVYKARANRDPVIWFSVKGPTGAARVKFE